MKKIRPERSPLGGQKKIHWGIKFFLTMTSIYVVIFFINPNFIESTFRVFAKSFVNLLPMLLFVFSMIFIINIFFKPESIKHHLGHDSGIKWWIYTSIASLLILGPPYVLFPMLKDLRNHWMKYSLIGFFLNNRNVQPIFLPVMAYYFWLTFTIVITIYTIIFAFINANILGKIMNKNT